MLNEPFRILDNIPLIMCFASFETYQSRLLEIVTQKRGLTDAPQPTQLVPMYFLHSPDDAASALSFISHHFLFSHYNLPSVLPPAPPTSQPPLPSRELKPCVCLQGREGEMRDEK